MNFFGLYKLYCTQSQIKYAVWYLHIIPEALHLEFLLLLKYWVFFHVIFCIQYDWHYLPFFFFETLEELFETANQLNKLCNLLLLKHNTCLELGEVYD